MLYLIYYNFWKSDGTLLHTNSLIMNRSIAFLFLIGILISQGLLAQSQDTILVKMESNPFFFNILKSKEGEIFAGTSKGIFKIYEQNLQKVDDREGYIGFDEKGDLVIEKEGIKNYVERKFLYLLPFPEQSREEFHAGVDNDFYIVSNGMLYSYDIVSYKITFPNSSVRTISSNFVGTYSGIFFKNQKLQKPAFTDGYIREFEGRAFICFNDLMIRELPENGRVMDETNDIIHSFTSQVEDVFFSSLDKRYYVITGDQLIRLSQDLYSFEVLYSTEKGNMAFLGEMKNSIYFASNDKIILYSITLNSIDTIYQHTEPIVGGYTFIRNYYFLTENGFHVLNSDGSYQKLTDLKFAHTLLPVSNTEFLIGTDIGLWYFNSTSKELDELIPGVEFNKKALFKEGQTISAGSIKGLYTFSIQSITDLIKMNQIPSYNSFFSYKKEIIIASIIIFFIIGLLTREVIKGRQKIHYFEDQLEHALQVLDDQVIEPKVSRDQIEAYIKEKLAEASLKSITDHFNITTSQVYSILKPDKPGNIIQELRLEMVLEMKNRGVSTKDIANATGLSISYIRKIKPDDTILT